MSASTGCRKALHVVGMFGSLPVHATAATPASARLPPWPKPTKPTNKVLATATGQPRWICLAGGKCTSSARDRIGSAPTMLRARSAAEGRRRPSPGSGGANAANAVPRRDLSIGGATLEANYDIV